MTNETKVKKVPLVKKGQVGYNRGFGFPLIVTRAYYGNPRPSAILEVEVYGLYHECGSIYYGEFEADNSLENWKANRDITPEGREAPYFKGELVA